MSQPQLRPNSTISTTGLSVVGGASADVVLDDAPAADGSYIQNTGSSAATATLGLTDPTWPAGAVSKSARIQLRARGISGSLPGRGYVELRSGSVVVAKLDLSTWTSTSFVPKTAAWFPITLTQAEVNALTAYVRLNKSQTNPYPVIASELYVDLILAERATAAITTVTTAYSTSTITTDWSHTPGADGGDQSHYRLIWLTAAQVATITGGDPTTSTAGSAFDSGAVESSAGSATAAGLPAGTLTRYVATADLVNGQPHWSAWVSQSVTVTLSTAEALSVSPTVDDALGRVGVTVARDTGKDAWATVDVERLSGVDSLSDVGDMEAAATAGVVGGWVGGNWNTPTSVSYSAVTVSGHGQVQRITATTTAGSGGYVATVAQHDVTGAATVDIFVDAYSAAWGNNQLMISAVLGDAAGALIGIPTVKLPSVTGWARYGVTFVLPANATTAKALIGVVGTTGGAVVADIDSATMIIGETWRALEVPAPATNTVTAYDYLLPPGETAIYRARAVKTGPVAGSWIYSADTVWSYPTGQLWLKVPDTPAMNMRLWVVSTPLENTRPRRQIIHDILPDGASSARRVVAYGPLQGRVTELVAWTETRAEAAQLEAIVRSGVVVLHPPTDWRFAAGTFALGAQVEDVSDEIATGYEYQQWRITLTEVD